MPYLSRGDVSNIRRVLEDMARREGLKCKNEYRISSSYIDHVWFKEIEDTIIPVAAFEIESRIPSNERLKKDIFNLLITKAPRGYLIIPKQRIESEEPKQRTERGWWQWFKNTFPKAIKEYIEIFSSFIEITLIDADKLLQTKSLTKSKIQFK